METQAEKPQQEEFVVESEPKPASYSGGGEEEKDESHPTRYYRTDLEGSILRVFDTETRSSASTHFETVTQVFDRTVKKHATSPALAYRQRHIISGGAIKLLEGGCGSRPWVSVTWQGYWEECRHFAKALISIGIQEKAVVNILGSNSPQWFIGTLGSILAACIPAGVYPTTMPDTCGYIAGHSRAAILLVDGKTQLMKYVQTQGPHDSLAEHLKAIVVWNESQASIDAAVAAQFTVPVYLWSEFLDLGRQCPSLEEDVDRRQSYVLPGQCASLVYTSGTTGPPKAVMLSHDNITWTAKTFLATCYQMTSDDRLVSYLPLSHISAQMVDLYAPLVTGACTYFCDPSALLAKIQPGGSTQLIDTLREVKPTLFFAVPRVWEKLQSNIMQQQQQSRNILKRAMVSWARTVGAQRCKQVQFEEGNYFGPPCGYALADKLVLSPVKSALGLDQARALYSSAAPLSQSTQQFFASFNMPIFEVYGQSECTGPHSASYNEMWKIGFSGRALPGTQSKIHQPTGELLIRGRHVFMGYLYSPELTKGAFDEEGYFHTGDTAEIDEDGFICITGRIKELLVTSGGENIPFLLIEEAIKAAMPAISHCIVLGDGQKFPSALLTLKTKIGVGEREGEPTPVLAREALAVSDHIGSRATTVQEAQEDTLWSIYINSGIREANRRLASRAHHVRSWRLLPLDFTEHTGELTPTHKERRKIIMDKYADVIESIYESGEHHS